MAKAKIVLALLVTAKALLEANENENLRKAIDELEILEDATHSTTEYKNLRTIVDELENNTGDDKSNQNETKNVNNDDLKSNNEDEKKVDENNTGDETIIEKPKRLNYAGIKMIGSKWYSSKDNYKKSFATADECAMHFN